MKTYIKAIIEWIIIFGLLTTFIYAAYTGGYNQGLDDGIIKGESNVKNYMEYTLNNVGLTYLDIDFHRVYLKPVELTANELELIRIKENRIKGE